ITAVQQNSHIRNKQIWSADVCCPVISYNQGIKECLAGSILVQTWLNIMRDSLLMYLAFNDLLIYFMLQSNNTFYGQKCLVAVPWNDKKPFTTKELDDIMSSCISVCRI
ncbi:hypothetical protein Tco_1350549, partial [Tanacetum coccineum]